MAEFSIESTVDRKELHVRFVFLKEGGMIHGSNWHCLLFRMLKAEKAFENVFAIAVLPIPQYSKLQLLAIRSSVKIKMFSGML